MCNKRLIVEDLGPLRVDGEWGHYQVCPLRDQLADQTCYNNHLMFTAMRGAVNIYSMRKMLYGWL